MASAGKIFNTEVVKVSAATAGSKTFDFVIENDGCIVAIEKISGSGNATGTFVSNQPDPMSEVVLETFTVPASGPVTFAHIVGTRASLNLTWDSDIELMATVKFASGSAVATINPLVIAINTFDGFVTQQFTTTTGVTQIINTAERKAIAIRNWSDLAGTQILYVKEDGISVTDGWPLAAGEGLALDVDANTTLYLTTSAGTIDTRIVEVVSTV